MKRLLLLLAFLMPVVVFADGNTEKKPTKYEEFTSNSGRIIKFVDIEMSNIPQYVGTKLKCSVRTVIKENEKEYYYRIELNDTYIEMIEYKDLIDVNKALSILVSEAPKDAKSRPDYLECKYFTQDGFCIGYYVKKSKVSWYISIDGENTLLSNLEATVSAFKEAQAKIEEISK